MNSSCTSLNESCVDEDQSHLDHYNTQFLVYFGIRVVQVTIEIIGNGCTLIIIPKLKKRVNGHIIMFYLAVSDILVCCTLPVSYLRNSSTIEERYWKNFCIISEYFYIVIMTYSVMSYITASIDRYVNSSNFHSPGCTSPLTEGNSISCGIEVNVIQIYL